MINPMEGPRHSREKEDYYKNRMNEIPAKNIHLWKSVLNHLPMVIIIALVLMVLGIGAVYYKVPPLYKAKAQILIEPVTQKILYRKEDASITSYYDDFVRTQISIIKSFSIISKVVDSYRQQGFKWQLPKESFQNAVERLTALLEIKQLRDSQIISLSLIGPSNEGLAELVNLIASTFVDSSKDAQVFRDSEKLQFLKSRKEHLEEELKKRYDSLNSSSEIHTVGMTDEKNIYVYLQAIIDVQGSLVKATTKKIQTETRLNELRKQMKKLGTLDISGDVDEWVEKDSAIEDNRIQMSRKLQQMRLVLAGMKENHPDRKQFDKSFEKLVEVQTRMRRRATEKAKKVIRGKLFSNQNRKIFEMEVEYASARSTEKKLSEKLAEAEKKAAKVNSQMLRASTARKEIKRIQDSLLRIDERIDQLQVESRSPNRIYIMNEALNPENPSTAKRNKLFLAAIAFSLVGGIGYAGARDKLDRKIRTTQDVERVLGFPPTGFILDANQIPGLKENPECAVLDLPHSILSEQYKGIAWALSRERDEFQSSIYSFISLQEKQGTTSLLTNILSSLNTKKEDKIYVDLNLWNPQTQVDESRNSQGLWEVLEGQHTLRDVIVRDADLPFHILPLGNWQYGKDSLFQQIGLENIIQALRLDYKYIMIDAPPLLLTTDGKYLARMSDVTVLTLKANETTDEQLYRAVNLLDKTGIKVLSVVLNRAKLFRGGYYKSENKNYYQLTASGKGRKNL